MNTIEFRSLVLRKLDELDQLYACAALEPDLEVSAAFSRAAEDVGDAAARLGFAELFRRSRDLLGVPEYADTVEFLSKCLAAVPEPVKPERQLAATAPDYDAFVSQCLEAVPAFKPVPMPDAPLTVPEAARILKVSPDMVYSLCASGELRHTRLGKGKGIIRIDPSDLKGCRQHCTRQAEPDAAALYEKHARPRRKH
ncbi:MAG TPA: helix-turn-helix domain-containing protein [Pirellulales bacterium]|nr:helix-turn-helix domain-containing protein [Pirellulales bacterium]